MEDLLKELEKAVIAMLEKEYGTEQRSTSPSVVGYVEGTLITILTRYPQATADLERAIERIRSKTE